MERYLQQMEPIALADMKAVQLMNRVDQKYLTNTDTLPRLLQMIASNYFVQRIDGIAVSDYRTLYFDTPELAMYTCHHNRKLHRQKLRIRTYRSTLTTFFELKDKNNKGRTRKTRIRLPHTLFDNPLQSVEVAQFVQENTPFKVSNLAPQVENSFQRITLVDKGMHERVTIDYNIRFLNRHTSLEYNIPRLVIIEVKHEVGAPASAIEQSLQQLHIHHKRVSKYCLGTILTNPQAKYNRFKSKLRAIEQILEN